MRVLTINELLRLTRKELCDLAARITAALPHYPEGSAEELWRIFGDGVNQAADLASGATSIPSRNLTPLMTFGN
jgi:hypothetical protein